MAHPIMFDPDDPTLEQVRMRALALPGAVEKVTFGVSATKSPGRSILAFSMSLTPNTLIDAGTSCRDSDRMRAVTMISPESCES